MKIISPLLLTLLLISCDSAKEQKDESIQENEPVEVVEEEAAVVNWTNHIIQQTSSDRGTIDSSSYYSKVVMDTDFLEKFIFRVSPDTSQDFEFPAYTFPCYYWGERLREDSILVFTFIFSNEYCCQILYAASYDTLENRIIDIHEIALSGGDGMWYQFDEGDWINPTELKMVKKKVVEEYEPEDDSYTDLTTTRWVTTRIHSDGTFTSTLDSTFTIETKYE